MIGDAAKIIRESGKWQEAVQGCLAAGSFADDCVGHVLGALNKSAYKDNTVVILWGDHGYDICEKTFAKSALWQQTTRTPLIIHVPEKLGGNKSNANCNVCIFPVKHPSPLNCFAITNVFIELFKGLEEFFSRESQTVNDGTDYQESTLL